MIAEAGCLKRFIFDKLLRVSGQQRLAHHIKGARKLSYTKFRNLLMIKDQFNIQFRSKWEAKGLSALVSPVYPHCAPTKETVTEISGLMDYTMIWSLLGFPCGVLPVTRV